MELTQTTEKLNVTRSNLAGATFTDVNLAGAQFRDVNLSSSRFDDINLTGAKFTNVNLANGDIRDCAIDGLRIDGHLVSDLIKARGQQA